METALGWARPGRLKAARSLALFQLRRGFPVAEQGPRSPDAPLSPPPRLRPSPAPRKPPAQSELPRPRFQGLRGLPLFCSARLREKTPPSSSVCLPQLLLLRRRAKKPDPPQGQRPPPKASDPSISCVCTRGSHNWHKRGGARDTEPPSSFRGAGKPWASAHWGACGLLRHLGQERP